MRAALSPPSWRRVAKLGLVAGSLALYLALAQGAKQPHLRHSLEVALLAAGVASLLGLPYACLTRAWRLPGGRLWLVLGVASVFRGGGGA